MSNHKIIILTGPIHSGKTSALTAYIKKFEKVEGILCPDIENGRNVHFLNTSIQKKIQVDDNFEHKITIGKFHFDANVMTEISSYLESINIETADLIVVDEIGKLELKDEGFEPGLSALINNFKTSTSNTKLLVVVRDYLVEEVMDKYDLHSVRLIHTRDLDEILI